MTTAPLFVFALCRSPEVGQEFLLGTEEGTMIFMAMVSVLCVCLGLGSANRSFALQSTVFRAGIWFGQVVGYRRSESF